MSAPGSQGWFQQAGVSPNTYDAWKQSGYDQQQILGYQYDQLNAARYLEQAKQAQAQQEGFQQVTMAQLEQEMARLMYQQQLDDIYNQQRTRETELSYLGMLYDRGNRPDTTRAVSNLRTLMSGY